MICMASVRDAHHQRDEGLQLKVQLHALEDAPRHWQLYTERERDAYTYVYMYICIYIYIYIHISIHTHMSHNRSCTYVCIYIYI